MFSYGPEQEPSPPGPSSNGATYAIYWNETTIKLWILPLEQPIPKQHSLGEVINISDLSTLSHGEINSSMNFPSLQRWPDLTHKMNLVSPT